MSNVIKGIIEGYLSKCSQDDYQSTMRELMDYQKAIERGGDIGAIAAPLGGLGMGGLMGHLLTRESENKLLKVLAPVLSEPTCISVMSSFSIALVGVS